jgi:Protein kinase domain
MVSSDLGACEWFVWDLRRSGLIDRGHLDQVVGEFLKRNPRAEPPGLAEYLVAQSVLTPFQSERILQGKTQGLVLGPYVLADAIGAGSMGQVYKAQSKTDNQWYAVKVLPRRSMWNVRLARRQVRSFGQFNHPAVVPFVDVGTSGGQHYLVWPLAEGETLETRVMREGRLFHGLLKPSNILIGSDGIACILDFGIGSLLAENEGESLVDTMSTANTLTSGLDCSSPESIMEPTNRTQAGDQYSFGCVLYYCLAGRYPFPDGTAVEKMMAHQFKQPTPIREVVADVPDGLAVVIERVMQKAPDGRYTGVEELVEALQPFATDLPRRAMMTGSQHGAARGAGSSHGSRFGVPGSATHRALPASSAQVATPPGGPLTPVPASRFGGSSYGGTDVRTAVPVAPARGRTTHSPSDGVAAMAVRATPVPYQLHYALPEAQPVESPSYSSRPQPIGPGSPGWEEPRRAGAAGLVMIVLVTALVTLGVYYLGKNFLFPQ